jgi:hypothetical protein
MGNSDRGHLFPAWLLSSLVEATELGASPYCHASVPV